MLSKTLKTSTGLFSGWDAEKHEYDPQSWAYKGVPTGPAAGKREMYTAESHAERGTQMSHLERDETLQNPKCVFQID